MPLSLWVDGWTVAKKKKEKRKKKVGADSSVIYFTLRRNATPFPAQSDSLFYFRLFFFAWRQEIWIPNPIRRPTADWSNRSPRTVLGFPDTARCLLLYFYYFYCPARLRISNSLFGIFFNSLSFKSSWKEIFWFSEMKTPSSLLIALLFFCLPCSWPPQDFLG